MSSARSKAVQVAVIAVLLAISTGSAARAAGCGLLATIAMDVEVREAPLITQRNLSRADLEAMAVKLGRPTAHPVLGLYVGTIGHVVRNVEVVRKPSISRGDRSCPRVLIHADLVAVDRRVVVASDLSNTSCLLGAALDHYRRHAMAAHVALQDFAAALPGALEPSIAAYVQKSSPREAGGHDLRAYLDQLLDTSVATFTDSLANVQAKVDSPDEVRRLTIPCTTI